MINLGIKFLVIMSITFGATSVKGQVPKSIQNQINFTKYEEEYIRNKKLVKVVGRGAMAPIQAYDSLGVPEGISIELINELANLTGLDFEVALTDESLTNNIKGNDIVMGVVEPTMPSGWKATSSYATTEGSIFIREGIPSNDLMDQIMATYYDYHDNEISNDNELKNYSNIENAMMAVNNGKADFGFGNFYSVSYYNWRHKFNKIYTVPLEEHDLSFVLGVNPDDKILYEIISKALDAIDDVHMGRVRMRGIANVYDRKTSHGIRFIEDHSTEFVLFLTTMFFALLVLTLKIRQTKNELLCQQKCQETFMALSDELFFEYDAIRKAASFPVCAIDRSDKEDLLLKLESVFAHPVTNSYSTLMHTSVSGNIIVYEMTHNNIFDVNGNLTRIIGKLIDNTDRVEEKVDLIKKTRTDSLTGFYNARYTKEKVQQLIESRRPESTDVLVVLDLDDFKDVNDTHGHLRGDEILVNVSRTIDQLLEGAGLWGRVGGDEFLMYLQDIGEVETLIHQLEQFVPLLRKISNESTLAGTIGIALVKEGSTYESVFSEADKALYHGKRVGKSQIVYYDTIK